MASSQMTAVFDIVERLWLHLQILLTDSVDCVVHSLSPAAEMATARCADF